MISISCLLVGLMELKYKLIFNQNICLLISLVFLLGTVCTLYSHYYMGKQLKLGLYYFMMFCFVISMLTVISCQSFFSFIMGWDGLAISSFFLINFYNNKSATKGAFMTMMINRLGDLFLLAFFGLLMVGMSHNDFLYTPYYWFTIFCILGWATKSALFPFCSWLPLAMSAPTPISALVHSSTLVMAGIVAMYRYLSNDMSLNLSVWMWMSVATFFLGSLLANIETDLKKMIAYSTLSNMGLMGVGLYTNMLLVVLMHMCVHGVFKATLFLQAGEKFLQASGSQRMTSCGSLSEYMNWNFLVFSTLGVPGFSYFYTKHLISDSIWMTQGGVYMFLFMFFGTAFSISYSIRLLMVNSFVETTFTLKWGHMPSYVNFMLVMNVLLLMSILFYMKTMLLFLHPTMSFFFLATNMTAVCTYVWLQSKPKPNLLHWYIELMWMLPTSLGKLMSQWLSLLEPVWHLFVFGTTATLTRELKIKPFMSYSSFIK